MKITYIINPSLRNELILSNKIEKHFEYIQPLLDAPKALSNKTIFTSTVHNSRHVSRVAYLIKTTASIYRWIYANLKSQNELESLNDQLNKELFYYQLAALFHDSGREGDGDDTIEWEQDSAINFYNYLTQILSVSSDQALVLAQCIINKDAQNIPGGTYCEMTEQNGTFAFTEKQLTFEKPIGWILLHTADCLDVIRARKSFNPRFLDFFKIFLKHNQETKLHFLLTSLIREVTCLITITGNDRYVKNTKYASFEAEFYRKPENSYKNIIELIDKSPRFSEFCQNNTISFSFSFLSTLHKIAENSLPLESLTQLFDAHSTPLTSSTVSELFSLGSLWGGNITNFSELFQEETIALTMSVNALRLIPGGYLPLEVGLVTDDLSNNVMDNNDERFLTAFYNKYPKNAPDYFCYPVELRADQITGLYYQTDYNRRSIQWIRSKIKNVVPSECYSGRYMLMIYIMHAYFKKHHDKNLPIHILNLSTGTILTDQTLSFNEVMEEIKNNITLLCKTIADGKIQISNANEVRNFFTENKLLFKNNLLSQKEKKLLKKNNMHISISDDGKIALTEWSEVLKNIIFNAQITNRFALYLLTHHPATHFKREKYFPELLSKLPEKYTKLTRPGEADDKEYTTTRYLTKHESKEYRVFIQQDGMLVTPKNHQAFSTETENDIVCVTLKGEIFSATKKNKIQHTSFNRGGYLLFSGNWSVKEGKISKINADSGHYEPSAPALKNFMYLLSALRCDLKNTKFLYSLRTMIENPTSLNYYKKTPRELSNESLLNHSTDSVLENDQLVTPRKIFLLTEASFWGEIVVNSARESNKLPKELSQNSSKNY